MEDSRTLNFKPDGNESGTGGTTVTVEDNLVSTSSTNALSANMGRVLDEKIPVLPVQDALHDAILATTPHRYYPFNNLDVNGQFPTNDGSGHPFTVAFTSGDTKATGITANTAYEAQAVSASDGYMYLPSAINPSVVSVVLNLQIHQAYTGYAAIVDGAGTDFLFCLYDDRLAANINGTLFSSGAGGVYTVDETCQVAAYCDDTTLKLWFNGVEVLNVAHGTGSVSSNIAQVFKATSSQLNATIDDLVIYDREITPAELLTMLEASRISAPLQVIDNLTSESSTNALSANMGKDLNEADLEMQMAIEANAQAIANLAVANAVIINQTTPSFADIPTTDTLLPFTTDVDSTDTNIMTLDDAGETLTFLADSDIDFTSVLQLTSSINTATTVTFKLIDTSDNSVLVQQDALLTIPNNDTQQVTLNTLLTVGLNGIPSAPLTIRVETVASNSGYSLDSFNSKVKAGTDRNAQPVMDLTINGVAGSVGIGDHGNTVYSGDNGQAYGTNAGYSNTAGSNWIAQGSSAGYSNTTGSYWIAQGTNAGYLNTTGSYWLAQGNNAGYSNTTESYWLAQGNRAGYSNTTGSYWIAQGSSAGYSNTTGSYWIAQGSNAGYSNTTGSNWIAQGNNAGISNTTESYWIAQGSSAGYSNTTGSYWLAQGNRAGYSNNTGSYWLAQGNNAGYLNTAGSYWLAQGNKAGYSNTTGSYWIAQGNNAGYSNTAGSNWIAQGSNAGYDITTASNFTVLGCNTGRGITTGEANTIVGANVTGLPSNLTNNIILSAGDGTGIQEHADNAAAITAGLIEGKSIYRTPDGLLRTPDANPTPLPAGAPTLDGGGSIGFKTVTGTLSSTAGASVNIAHGVTDPADILSITAIGIFSATVRIPQGLNLPTIPDFEFNYYVSGANIAARTSNTNSTNMLGNDVRFFITYLT